MYVTPFSAPYDPLVIILNVWLAAAYLIEDRQGQMGNENTLGARLKARVDEYVADLLAGTRKLTTVPVRDSAVDGNYSSMSSTLADGATDPDPMTFGWTDPDSSLSRY
jgi:hypothetical protein